MSWKEPHTLYKGEASPHTTSSACLHVCFPSADHFWSIEPFICSGRRGGGGSASLSLTSCLPRRHKKQINEQCMCSKHSSSVAVRSRQRCSFICRTRPSLLCGRDRLISPTLSSRIRTPRATPRLPTAPPSAALPARPPHTRPSPCPWRAQKGWAGTHEPPAVHPTPLTHPPTDPSTTHPPTAQDSKFSNSSFFEYCSLTAQRTALPANHSLPKKICPTLPPRTVSQRSSTVGPKHLLDSEGQAIKCYQWCTCGC